jgi:hypothetical protein
VDMYKTAVIDTIVLQEKSNVRKYLTIRLGHGGRKTRLTSTSINGFS